MKLFKYVVLPLLVLFVLIAAAGIYRFNFTSDDIYLVTQDGSVVPHDSTKNHLANLLPLDEKIKGDFLVKLPETSSDIQVALTSFSLNGKLKLASGKYSDGEVRGDIMLDYNRIFPLQLPDEGALTSFVAPFAVTTQGSGVFWYLGLFCLDHHTGRIRHLESEFIGDRIKIDNIDVVEPFVAPYQIQLSYRDRSEALAMAQEPDVTRERKYSVSATSLTPIAELY